MERFEFTEIQAKEILDMRLAKLTGLEKEKIEDEIARLHVLIDQYNTLLSSRDNIVEQVLKELDEIKENMEIHVVQNYRMIYLILMMKI